MHYVYEREKNVYIGMGIQRKTPYYMIRCVIIHFCTPFIFINFKLHRHSEKNCRRPIENSSSNHETIANEHFLCRTCVRV